MRTSIHIGLIVTLAFGLPGCDKAPTAPSPTQSLPTGGLRPFHLSGVATDDEGRPLAGAQVLVDFAYVDAPGVGWRETRSDAKGRYEADFEAKVGAYARGATALVTIIGEGHERDDRWFRPISTDANQTLDLHPRVIRWISVGQAVPVTVADDGQPCINNVRDTPGYSVHFVCRTVRLVVPADGVLTATAESADPSGVQALVVMEGPGDLDCCYLGNPLNMTVTAGMVIKISVEILEGVPSQTFKLTATIR